MAESGQGKQSEKETPSNQELSLNKIGQISIAVHDLGRAVAFYRDTLKMTFLFEAPPGLAFFDCGGVRLMLTLPDSSGSDHHSSNIYYTVEDIQAAAKTLLNRGVTFERDPELVARLADREIWMAFFRDPDHNLLALMSEIQLEPN